MDDIDLAILRALQLNDQLSRAALGEQVGLTAAPAHRRVKALEDAGVITRYVALISPDSMLLSQVSFISVVLASDSRDIYDKFERAVARLPEIVECHRVAGSARYLLKLITRDIDTLNQICDESILRIEGVWRIEHQVSLKTVKYTTALPI